MPECIYTSVGDGTLEALEEARFPTEGELQLSRMTVYRALKGEDGSTA